MLYNISLVVYYECVVVFGYRQTQLLRFQRWFHVIPCSIAIALAFGGLPFYDVDITVCHIGNYTNYSGLFFVGLPVASTLVIVCLAMVHLYVTVRRVSRRANKWRFAENSRAGETRRSRASFYLKSSKVEQEVFSQAVWHLVAFLIPHSFIFSTVVTGNPSPEVRWLSEFASQLQPMLNAVVFFRPQIKKAFKSWRCAIHLFASWCSRSQKEPDPSEEQQDVDVHGQDYTTETTKAQHLTLEATKAVGS